MITSKIAEIVVESRRAQGLPPHVEDEDALRRVAVVLEGAADASKAVGHV